MEEAIKYLGQRKKNYEEQIESYHNYVEAAMQTMQRGKGCVSALCDEDLTDIGKQEEAIRPAFYQAVLPPARPSEGRE